MQKTWTLVLVHGVMSKSRYHREELSEGEGRKSWERIKSASRLLSWGVAHLYWDNSEHSLKKGILSFGTASTESIVKNGGMQAHMLDFIPWDWQSCTSQVGAVWWSKLTVAYICWRAYWFQVRVPIGDDSRVYISRGVQHEHFMTVSSARS